MLLETDSPFLSPEPYRGLGNEPKNVKITAAFIAKLRNISLEALSDVTSKNAERVFEI
jgi:TatD DNase family protein